MKPLPAKPTNVDLAQAIAQVHDCIHEHRKEVNGTLSDMDIKISKMETAIGRLAIAFGLDPDHAPHTSSGELKPPPGKPIALMTQGEAAIKGLGVIGGAIAGLFIIIKIGVAVWPALAQGFEALLKVATG